MANHKSSKKRIRQTVAKRAHNRLYHKTRPLPSVHTTVSITRLRATP